MDNVAARYFFGTNGNAAAIRQDGWSVDEPGFTWSMGTQSHLKLPLPEGPGGAYSLEISLNPMLAPPALRRQRLIVEVNGQRLADEQLSSEAVLGMHLPPSLTGSGSLDITLHHPNAQIPAELGISPDPRRLGFAVHDLILLRETAAPAKGRSLPPLPVAAAGNLANAVRFLTALTPAELGAQFENLGRDAALGLVQRALGAEPASLLRFANTTARRLVLALDAGFENLAARPNLFAFTRDESEAGEWMVRDATYLTEFHTGQTAGQISADALLDQFAPHLAELHRRFLDTLAEGGKIFVFHDSGTSAAQMRPLLTMLRAHGPNSLLFLAEDASLPPGSVSALEPGLFMGHVPPNPPWNVEIWVSILANTYRLWREAGGSAS